MNRFLRGEKVISIERGGQWQEELDIKIFVSLLVRRPER